MASNIKIKDDRLHATCKLLKSSKEGNSDILARVTEKLKKRVEGGRN